MTTCKEPRCLVDNYTFRRRTKRTKLTKEYLEDLGLSEQEYKIIEYIKDHRKIKSSDVQKMFTVRRDTANRYLKRLIESEIIERRGIGRAIYYILKYR